MYYYYIKKPFLHIFSSVLPWLSLQQVTPHSFRLVIHSFIRFVDLYILSFKPNTLFSVAFID